MADHLGLEPGMLWVRLPPEPLWRAEGGKRKVEEQEPSVTPGSAFSFPLSALSRSSRSSRECSPPCHGGDRGFKSHRGRLLIDMARYANRQSGRVQTSVIAGSTPACATQRRCVGWALAGLAGCKPVVRLDLGGSTPSRRTPFRHTDRQYGPFF